VLDRVVHGDVPQKPHVVFRSSAGKLRYEECITRRGFDGAYTIVYHEERPHEAEPAPLTASFELPEAHAVEGALARRHFRCLELPTAGASALECRVPLLFNDDLVLGFARPSAEDRAYFVNADADELLYLQEGRARLRSPFGDLRLEAQDYAVIPKGTLYRFIPEPGVPQAVLSLELRRGIALPSAYRNEFGQLRMDAPYSHRDFRRPEFAGPLDEGIRALTVKRGERFHGFALRHSPLDLVGWDGSVYPFAFPILAFEPRVGQIHLPPTAHATFQAGGALICSFVPRPLDFHPLANPIPYPHSSVDIDEVLFYSNGAFGSRRGIAAGSLSLHPAGIPHGPHPGAYESKPTSGHTEEVAVMLDCTSRLFATKQAVTIEDAAYHASFRG
jgi:homogentisate 1,2-dioxygenase